MTGNTDSILIRGLTHHYGDRLALSLDHLEIKSGEIFGLMGPNGSGKTTLFRILTTLMDPQAGRVTVSNHPIPSDSRHIRALLGVVFQTSSLDKKLTVQENLMHQGHLYALSGAGLEHVISETLTLMDLNDRRHDRVESLSGGLRRRVELAKSLLHQPQILLLDEPTAGVDPGSRRDFWETLVRLKNDRGVTVVVTTHLMEEAEKCDRLAILNEGKLAMTGSPSELRAQVGGDVVTIHSTNALHLAEKFREIWEVTPLVDGDRLRMEVSDAAVWVRRVMEQFPREVQSVTVGHPTLEDAFFHVTGRKFAWQEPVTTTGRGKH